MLPPAWIAVGIYVVLTSSGPHVFTDRGQALSDEAACQEQVEAQAKQMKENPLVLGYALKCVEMKIDVRPGVQLDMDEDHSLVIKPKAAPVPWQLRKES